MMGALIFAISAVFTFGNKAEAPVTPALEQRADGWYSAAATTLPLVRLATVIDGDTVDVLAAQTPLRIRAFGIDAPELDQRCAAAATARLGELAANGMRLQPDDRLQDEFGRELRYLFTVDGLSIDSAMVSEGLARAWHDDGVLRDHLVALEDEARDARRGCLWTSG